MIIECYGYYDPDCGMTICTAEKGEHEYCKRYSVSNNGKPCIHFRADLNNGRGCDNSAIQFEAWQASLKEEK